MRGLHYTETFKEIIYCLLFSLVEIDLCNIAFFSLQGITHVLTRVLVGHRFYKTYHTMKYHKFWPKPPIGMIDTKQSNVEKEAVD